MAELKAKIWGQSKH